ncbi:unnamed protein product [Bursaphelenchus okinawaensis]|uniref:Uncharacterized protein n=1 Tax=Bursaphelenchus okinawaensis TaxID=465554 RepID=A0A811JWM5_9BILA|nr:unnamed protein product [Bursaphelenchus okinawaensis]CAG9085944.1 unnamed protein product [Bursaphelenchus okinawaensis]
MRPTLTSEGAEWMLRWSAQEFEVPKARICLVSTKFLKEMPLSGKFHLFVASIAVSTEFSYCHYVPETATVVEQLLRVLNPTKLNVWLAAQSSLAIVRQAVALVRKLRKVEHISLAFYFPAGSRLPFQYFLENLYPLVRSVKTSWALYKRFPDELVLDELVVHNSEFLLNGSKDTQNYTALFGVNTKSLAVHGNVDFDLEHFKSFVPNEIVERFEYYAPMSIYDAAPLIKNWSEFFPKLMWLKINVQYTFPLFKNKHELLRNLFCHLQFFEVYEEYLDDFEIPESEINETIVAQTCDYEGGIEQIVMDLSFQYGKDVITEGFSTRGMTTYGEDETRASGEYVIINFDNNDMQRRRVASITIWVLDDEEYIL